MNQKTMGILQRMDVFDEAVKAEEFRLQQWWRSNPNSPALKPFKGTETNIIRNEIILERLLGK